jgi:two-component system, OmpR family, phosphate regulon sensor histidine kinase PhoR
MRRRSLFWQMFPAYLLLTAGLLLLLLLETRGRLRDFYLDQTSSDLAASAAMFAESAKTPLERGDYTEVDALAKRLGKASGIRITVVMPSGEVVAESEEDPVYLENHRTRLEVAAALDTHSAAHDVRHSTTLDQDLLYVAVPLLRKGQPWTVVRVATPATALNDVLAKFERRIVYGTLLVTAVMVAASWLISRRISRPLETISHGAERFGRGDLDYRLPVSGSQETATLAETFNAMGRQLSEQIQTAAVQKSEQEAVFHSMEDGVLTLDNEGTILDLNGAASQMFQLDPEKTRGRPIHEVLRKADVLRFVDEALSTSQPLQADIVIYDKERRLMTAYGNSLHNARGERIGILAVFRQRRP